MRVCSLSLGIRDFDFQPTTKLDRPMARARESENRLTERERAVGGEREGGCAHEEKKKLNQISTIFFYAIHFIHFKLTASASDKA